MLVELEWLGPRPSQVAFVGQSPFRRCCGLAASTAPSHDHDLGLFGARKAAWQTPTPGACSSRFVVLLRNGVRATFLDRLLEGLTSCRRL